MKSSKERVLDPSHPSLVATQDLLASTSASQADLARNVMYFGKTKPEDAKMFEMAKQVKDQPLGEIEKATASQVEKQSSTE